MSYVALYRKFRPQTFDQLKGQDHVVRTLKNQLIHQRIGHAYLFTGTRGTGKTSAAKIFAKAVNCLHPAEGEPCNECENCRAVNAGNFVDVVEVDAASNNGVDDIRRIIEEVRYTPVKGAYKVFIIDEAHMITGAAFNAFLKTLEEPPAYAVFIMATTEPHKLPITILSRCQRYDFHRIASGDIVRNLAQIVEQEGTKAEEKALAYIARIGDGSMRDSISLLDKCIAFHLGEELTYESVLDTLGTVDTEVFSRLFRHVYAGDAVSALMIAEEAVRQGRDLTQFVTDFIWYIRNLLMTAAAQIKDPDILGISPENMQQLLEDAAAAQPEVLMRYIRILSELINQIRFSTSKQVLLEMNLIKLARPQMETDTASLADRIRQLEAGRTVQGTAPAPAYPEQEYIPEFPEMVYEPEPACAPEPSFPEPAEPHPAAGTQGQTEMEALWQQLKNTCDNPRIRITLQKCRAVPSGDNTVRILAPSEFAWKQLQEETVLAGLRQAAERIAGRTIDIQTVHDAGTASVLPEAAQFPEELLHNINFEIGTEER